MSAQPPDLHRWQPFTVKEVQQTLHNFHRWVLCGGHSIDWLLNKTTRHHHDIDIGVFRSDLLNCLNALDASQVYLCDPPGSLKAWNGTAVPIHVHDIWVTDTTHRHWAFQIMVYDDEHGHVTYRRDKRISWKKQQHAIEVRGIDILNPVVTILFKSHRSKLRDRDCADIAELISAVADYRDTATAH